MGNLKMIIREEDKAYFEKLSIGQKTIEKEQLLSEEDVLKVGRALDRAHDLRRFEIEMYWKRSTYFWAFQAAAFVMLGVLLDELRMPEDNPIVLLLPVFFGAITAQAAYLSARGSKFWQENWEEHVDMLGRYVEGRLLEVIWTGGQSCIWSVSGVNRVLLGMLTLAWAVGFFIIGIIGVFSNYSLLGEACIAIFSLYTAGAAFLLLACNSESSILKTHTKDKENNFIIKGEGAR
ncbi:MAG: hypothetical protein KUG59_03325 [Parvibaculaceae bacterium]|nr:hypothetical protein [Parvibaculaceae bacterium]